MDTGDTRGKRKDVATGRYSVNRRPMLDAVKDGRSNRKINAEDEVHVGLWFGSLFSTSRGAPDGEIKLQRQVPRR